MNEPDDLMTAAQVLARWKGVIAPSTLANWRNIGRGPSFVKVGRKVLYRRDDIIAWESQHLKTTETKNG